jgi:hypothetical protein
MSRTPFVYIIGCASAIGILVFVLYKTFAVLITSEHAALVITALVFAFVTGVLSAITVIYLGVRLRAQDPVASGKSREHPPRKFLLYGKSTRHLGSIQFGVTAGPNTSQIAVQPEAPIPFVQDGVAHVLDTPARRKNSAIVEWTETDPKTSRAVVRTVDVQTLRRFARLHTPARSEWSGKNATYSECLAFFRFANWVMPATEAGRGVVWQLQYQNLQRRLRYLGDLAEFSPASEISQAPYPNEGS